MRPLVAAGSAALLLFGATVPAQATAADTTPPVVDAVELSRDAITVSGLEAKLLMVSVHITDESGVTEAWLSIGRAVVALTLGRGTPTDGWFTGGAAVTSDWSGSYQPDYLSVADTAGNVRSGGPATMELAVPTVEVTGDEGPELELSFTPGPAAVNSAVTATVQVTKPDGKPWAGVPVAIGYDIDCAEDTIRAPQGRTNTKGAFSRTLPAGRNHDLWFCAWATGDDVPDQRATRIGSTSGRAVYRYTLAARPSATSVPAGTDVQVTGTLAPDRTGKELQLQRRHAGDDWRTVNRGRTDDRSAFSIAATPPGAGTYTYRVFAPADADRASAASPAFTISGF